MIAAGVAGVISGLSTAASWLAAHLPFLMIGAAIAFLIFVARQAGVSFEEMGAIVGGVFGELYAVIYNLIAGIYNQIITFIEFFVNVWNDPLTALAQLFAGLFDNILAMIENVAQAIDKLLGTNMSNAVSGFRDKVSGWVDNKFGENAVKLKRMSQLGIVDTVIDGSKFGSKLDNMGGNLNNLMDGMGAKDIWEGIGNNTGDTAGNTAKMADSMDILDEELQYLRDAAEQEIINRFTLADMKIDISNSNTLTTKTDFDDVNHMFGDVTAEALATMAEGAYA